MDRADPIQAIVRALIWASALSLGVLSCCAEAAAQPSRSPLMVVVPEIDTSTMARPALEAMLRKYREAAILYRHTAKAEEVDRKKAEDAAARAIAEADQLAVELYLEQSKASPTPWWVPVAVVVAGGLGFGGGYWLGGKLAD